MKSRHGGELHYFMLVQLAMNMHGNNLTLQYGSFGYLTMTNPWTAEVCTRISQDLL